jgi:hypothetical protein
MTQSSAPRTRCSGERGETLAEILVTIGIVGLAVVALVGALATGIAASAGHRQHASADTIARSVAEAIKDRQVALDANGNYASSTWSTVDTSGFTVALDSKCLNAASSDAATIGASDFGGCPSTAGVQLVTVTVTSDGGKGEQESVSIVKRRS